MPPRHAPSCPESEPSSAAAKPLTEAARLDMRATSVALVQAFERAPESRWLKLLLYVLARQR